MQKVSRSEGKRFYVTNLYVEVTTFLHILNYNYMIFTYAQAAFYEDKISYTSLVSPK